VQAESDKPIFLDLKLHDIPNTVAKSVLQVAELAPMFLTVHAAGGRKMIQAAADNLPQGKITAVTVLTSLDQGDLDELGATGSPQELAVRLAKISVSAGAKAIVCSPKEIAQIRKAVGDQILIITPGVRPKDTHSADDQKRTMDPKSAIAEGANYLVIGRPITGATDIANAASKILQEIKS